MTKLCIGSFQDDLYKEFKKICMETNFEELEKFISINFKWSIALKWPSGRWLRLTRKNDVAKYCVMKYKHIQTDYLGFNEDMCLIGSIQCDKKDYPILLGESKRIFCHNLYTDRLYFVAQDIEYFFLKGISVDFITPNEDCYNKYRYDGPRFELTTNLIKMKILNAFDSMNRKNRFDENDITDTQQRYSRWRYISALEYLDDLARCNNLSDVQKYVDLNAGLDLLIGYPLFYSLTIGSEKHGHISSSELKKFKASQKLYENMEIIGFLNENELTKLLIRPILCIGESGNIYFYDWTDKILFNIADCLLTFARIGFCRYLGDFSYQNIGPVNTLFGNSSTTGISFVKPKDTQLSKFVFIIFIMNLSIFSKWSYELLSFFFQELFQ